MFQESLGIPAVRCASYICTTYFSCVPLHLHPVSVIAKPLSLEQRAPFRKSDQKGYCLPPLLPTCSSPSAEVEIGSQLIYVSAETSYFDIDICELTSVSFRYISIYLISLGHFSSYCNSYMSLCTVFCYLFRYL